MSELPYDDDISPSRVLTGFGRWFPVAVASLALIGGIVFAGWQLNWWFTAHNATRQYEVTQNGVSNQDTLRAQITTQLANVTGLTTQIAEAGSDPAEVSALKAQRAAIADIACSDAGQVSGVPLPARQAQWVSTNCSDGSVSPGSPLYVTGAP